MKKLLLAICLCITYFTWADMPGNKPRAGVHFKFTNTKHSNQYTFFINRFRDNNSDTLKFDTTYLANEGYGAPRGAYIFGVNKETNAHTDSLHIDATEGNIEFNLDTVREGKMMFTINNLPETVQTPRERTVTLKEEKISGVNMVMLISLAAIGLMGLIAFFVMKK
jgi:hypothetical protein